jgi:transposase
MGQNGSHHQYDAEFKKNAVQLVMEKRKAMGEIARDLGIRYDLLSRWKREYEKGKEDAFPGKGHMTAEQERLRQLEKENADLREERDILKKALGIFSRQSR